MGVGEWHVMVCIWLIINFINFNCILNVRYGSWLSLIVKSCQLALDHNSSRSPFPFHITYILQSIKYVCDSKENIVM